MSLSNLKVGMRLALGFGVLLITILFVGGISWLRMSQLEAVVNRMSNEDEEKARITLQMQVRTLDNSAMAGRVLMSADDPALMDQLREKIAANSEANKNSLERLNELVHRPEAKALLQEAADARLKYNASRDKVTELAKNPKTHEEAVDKFRTETATLMEAYVTPFHKLSEFQQEIFQNSAGETRAMYVSARNTVIGSISLAVVFGVAIAFLLARSIVRPLANAVEVADAVKAGKLDNVIETTGRDETAQLLQSLDQMQSALRARDEKDADFRGQIAAIGASQAVIEFDMDGTVREVNDNFNKVMGYTKQEVVGKHHSTCVDATYANSAEYRSFWSKLNRGESDYGTYKRVAKGGREVWMSASYNPIKDVNGKPFKVVKYATDVTEQMVKNADFAGQLLAINKSQAVIEFDLDGTVRKINENFARTMGYSESEVIGRHESQFADPAQTASGEYRALWAKLNRGEAEVGHFKRIAKGGREVWLQASFNPIPDANGKPFKIAMYASDVTAAQQAQQQLQLAVSQTQETVKRAIDGDLTDRIPMAGKTGDLESLCRGINSMLESTADLVKRVKRATNEVQNGAEEISKGNTNLSQRTEEQASSLEETASSMEEMTSTVKQTADNAGQANQLAMAARQQAEKGGHVVGNAVTAMSGINAASKKIADIIGVIDEIAFQTNLLALNAAVEAARAGEQGRGFAVVATEVRNLAGRSATAAKEIKALIVDSVARVEEGSKLVDESGRTLEEIVMSVKKVTDIVAEIAAASREQSSGIEQVNKAVMQMDQTTQQNAALVEEAAAASQAIVEQAQALGAMISRYEVGDDARAAPRSAKPAAAAVRVERRAANRPWSNAPAQKAAAPAKAAASGDESEWNEF